MRQNGNVSLIGTSPVIAELAAEVERVARSDAKVLITGESGVGKEVVARAICAASPRAEGVRAGQLRGHPETLLESELFAMSRGLPVYRDKPGNSSWPTTARSSSTKSAR
jgi:DNA-binding NtrC family response regulator